MRERTARESLRELLDDDPRVQWFKELPGVTYWTDGTSPFIAEEYGDGKLELKTLVTPEQAIAATLGRESGRDTTCVPDDYTAKLMVEVERLQAENAKLRKLVEDMRDWLAPTAIGGGAPMKELGGRMRELRIEGDE